ncbi:hypothetical protein B0H16DRAFT_1535382 [Mycena metata]|uniref:Secreted protein n=1 Tax=Mycena metata TaxID=1033252 RepID=A0AAD7J7Y0_9AGAR|nr:hypothetical protein B0H16DRAFT_1535382 [Mycena metata]
MSCPRSPKLVCQILVFKLFNHALTSCIHPVHGRATENTERRCDANIRYVQCTCSPSTISRQTDSLVNLRPDIGLSMEASLSYLRLNQKV